MNDHITQNLSLETLHIALSASFPQNAVKVRNTVWVVFTSGCGLASSLLFQPLILHTGEQ